MRGPKRSWFKGLTRAKIEELEQRAAIGQRLESAETQRPFVEAFLKNLGTVLAHTPMEDWPPQVRSIWEYTKKEFPIGAEEYRKHLPPKK